MTDPGRFRNRLGPYQLELAAPNALPAYFRFADVFDDGQLITYSVDGDGANNFDIWLGTRA